MTEGDNNGNLITNCTFNNNTAENAGGAIYLNSPGNLQIKNCQFINNEALIGGSIYYSEQCILYILHLFFILFWQTASDKSLILLSNKFIKNVAHDNGGALYFIECSGVSQIINSSFMNSSIKPLSPSQTMGSIFYLENPGNITIVNSFFNNNTGIFGSAIYYSELRKNLNIFAFTKNLQVIDILITSPTIFSNKIWLRLVVVWFIFKIIFLLKTHYTPINFQKTMSKMSVHFHYD